MNRIALAAFAVTCSLPALAQDRIGVSNPPPVTADAQEPVYVPTPAYQPKPSAAHPADPILTPRETPREHLAGTPVAADTPIASIATRGDKDDPDAGIVTEVPHAENEFPAGTLLRFRIHQTISTQSTPIGTRFTADLIDPIEDKGHIRIPAGTVLDGTVTQIRGGHRIRGAAAIHLEPRNLTLPDGTHYDIHAQVVDTDENFATRIDHEGTIVRRDHIKTTLAVLGATTGAAAITGAVIGGGVGAAVGAGIGAGIGTAWWLKQDRQTTVPQDTALVFSLNEPLAMGTINR